MRPTVELFDPSDDAPRIAGVLRSGGFVVVERGGYATRPLSSHSLLILALDRPEVVSSAAMLLENVERDRVVAVVGGRSSATEAQPSILDRAACIVPRSIASGDLLAQLGQLASALQARTGTHASVVDDPQEAPTIILRRGETPAAQTTAQAAETTRGIAASTSPTYSTAAPASIESAPATLVDLRDQRVAISERLLALVHEAEARIFGAVAPSSFEWRGSGGGPDELVPRAVLRPRPLDEDDHELDGFEFGARSPITDLPPVWTSVRKVDERPSAKPGGGGAPSRPSQLGGVTTSPFDLARTLMHAASSAPNTQFMLTLDDGASLGIMLEGSYVCALDGPVYRSFCIRRGIPLVTRDESSAALMVNAMVERGELTAADVEDELNIIRRELLAMVFAAGRVEYSIAVAPAASEARLPIFGEPFVRLVVEAVLPLCRARVPDVATWRHLRLRLHRDAIELCLRCGRSPEQIRVLWQGTTSLAELEHAARGAAEGAPEDALALAQALVDLHFAEYETGASDDASRLA